MVATRHVPNGESNVFIQSLPRSGSTWLMELVLTQPGFRRVNEPLNLRNSAVRDHLALGEWADLHRQACKEKVHAYFAGLCIDSFRDPRFNYPSPLTRFYRAITRRVVFKINNAGEELVDWLAGEFNGKVVVLLRHPIPVSLSRKYFPELDSILNTEYAAFFTEVQLAMARDVMIGDDKFAKGVLDWCLRNAVVLRKSTERTVAITYEQLVVDPAPVVQRISQHCGLPKSERMFKWMSVPSSSTHQSSQDAQEVLHDGRDREVNRRWLVERWRNEVSDVDLSVATEIVNAFGLANVYKMGNVMAEKAYLI